LEDAAQSVIAGMETVTVICHSRRGSYNDNQVIATAITIQTSAIHKILVFSKLAHFACVLGAQSLIKATGNLEAQIRRIVQTG
jgi:hypothetical protein